MSKQIQKQSAVSNVTNSVYATMRNAMIVSIAIKLAENPLPHNYKQAYERNFIAFYQALVANPDASVKIHLYKYSKTPPWSPDSKTQPYSEFFLPNCDERAFRQNDAALPVALCSNPDAFIIITSTLTAILKLHNALDKKIICAYSDPDLFTNY